MLEHIATSVLRELLGQTEARIDEPKTDVEEKAEQLMRLACSGDKPGMERLIRSWPENLAREVHALIEKR
jgi:hypothetical protein